MNKHSLKTQSSMNNQSAILTDIELDAVTGGSGKAMAEAIARNVNGVKDVRNDILIRP